jgi:hypothetical protein
VVELTPPAGRDTTEKQGKSLVFWTLQVGRASSALMPKGTRR